MQVMGLTGCIIYKTFKVFRGRAGRHTPPHPYIHNVIHFAGELSCIPDSGGALKPLKEGIKEGVEVYA